MRIAIIGSGPSGWSAFQKAKKLGLDVQLIDAGLTDSNPRKNAKHQSQHSLARKLYFGSDLPYRDFPVGPVTIKQRVNPLSSFARGGLSLVWGATMLPYCQEDTENWPVPTSKLNSYFEEITQLIPVTGTSDGLSSIYGEFFSRRSVFQSPRIVRILETLESNAYKGFVYGSSRLAVETGMHQKSGCYYCNRCLNGCNDNFIWSSKDEFENQDTIRLRVTSIIENDSCVAIDGIDENGLPTNQLRFDKVFLAAGPLESFRILAMSKMVEPTAILKDSATFFTPLWVSPRLGRPELNSFALSQCFIKLRKGDLTSGAQFQLYEYSDDLILRAKQTLPMGRFIPTPMIRFFMKRLMVSIGYLDGESSQSILMTLDENQNLILKEWEAGISKNNVLKNAKQSIQNLNTGIQNSGIFALKFLTKFAMPGEGVHFGGWLPMGVKSDLQGRPQGSRNVHVIDSSVLPSIAPGPITFTVMANAMRIVEEACL
jgi:hypothetical protein